MKKIESWKAWAFIGTLGLIAVLMNTGQHQLLNYLGITPFQPIAQTRTETEYRSDPPRRVHHYANETETPAAQSNPTRSGDIELTTEWQGVMIPLDYQVTVSRPCDDVRCDARINKDPNRVQELPPNQTAKLGSGWFVEWRLHQGEQRHCKVFYEIRKIQ